MRLDEHTIDLFEIDDAGLVSHGLNEGTQTKVAGAAQESFAGANDQRNGLRAEGVVLSLFCAQKEQRRGSDGVIRIAPSRRGTRSGMDKRRFATPRAALHQRVACSRE